MYLSSVGRGEERGEERCCSAMVATSYTYLWCVCVGLSCILPLAAAAALAAAGVGAGVFGGVFGGVLYQLHIDSFCYYTHDNYHSTTTASMYLFTYIHAHTRTHTDTHTHTHTYSQ
eukprot:GHVQ01036080.1.p2 GENE.GHVQ01036080.1~~GHVQ01036080.1.p2  ORF type:complete len:116 (+),score=46.83 GHVQ01036080.1:159-506(+)